MKLNLLLETLLYHFELESEKKSRNDERTHFRDNLRILDMSVNPKCHIYVVFWTISILAIFWPFPVAFRI